MSTKFPFRNRGGDDEDDPEENDEDSDEYYNVVYSTVTETETEYLSTTVLPPDIKYVGSDDEWDYYDFEGIEDVRRPRIEDEYKDKYSERYHDNDYEDNDYVNARERWEQGMMERFKEQLGFKKQAMFKEYYGSKQPSLYEQKKEEFIMGAHDMMRHEMEDGDESEDNAEYYRKSSKRS